MNNEIQISLEATGFTSVELTDNDIKIIAKDYSGNIRDWARDSLYEIINVPDSLDVEISDVDIPKSVKQKIQAALKQQKEDEIQDKKNRLNLYEYCKHNRRIDVDKDFNLNNATIVQVDVNSLKPLIYTTILTRLSTLSEFKYIWITPAGKAVSSNMFAATYSSVSTNIKDEYICIHPKVLIECIENNGTLYKLKNEPQLRCFANGKVLFHKSFEYLKFGILEKALGFLERTYPVNKNGILKDFVQPTDEIGEFVLLGKYRIVDDSFNSIFNELRLKQVSVSVSDMENSTENTKYVVISNNQITYLVQGKPINGENNDK